MKQVVAAFPILNFNQDFSQTVLFLKCFQKRSCLVWKLRFCLETSSETHTEHCVMNIKSLSKEEISNNLHPTVFVELLLLDLFCLVLNGSACVVWVWKIVWTLYHRYHNEILSLWCASFDATSNWIFDRRHDRICGTCRVSLL